MVSSGTRWQCPRYRGFFVDRDIDEFDEGFEQSFQLLHQLAIGERHRRLGRQGFRQTLIASGKNAHRTARSVHGIDELQHGNHLALMIFHGDGQERSGAVAGTFIKAAGAGKIKTLHIISIGDIDGAGMQGGIGGDHAVVGLARCGVKRQIVKLVGKGLARGPTEGNTQAVIPDNGEFEPLAIFTDPVQGPPFGPGDGLGRQQDFFQQPLQVALAGKGGANIIQLLQTAE